MFLHRSSRARMDWLTHGDSAERQPVHGWDGEWIAGVLGVSAATANREWVVARAWLYRRLKQAAESGRTG